MDDQLIEIPFDPSDRDHLPAEVLEAIPPDKLDEFLGAMEKGKDKAVYRRGPAPADMHVVRYHDSNLPTTPDRPGWHVPLEDARQYALTDSVDEIRHAVSGADAAGTLVSQEARDYARGPGSPIDIREGVVLPRRYGTRDTESRLYVPKGAYVVTIESWAASKDGGRYLPNTPANERDDFRIGAHAYPGGNRQVLVLTYDERQCAVTVRPMAQSIDLSKVEPRPSVPATQQAHVEEALKRAARGDLSDSARTELIDQAQKQQDQALQEMVKANDPDAVYEEAKARWEQAKKNEARLRQNWDGPTDSRSRGI